MFQVLLPVVSVSKPVVWSFQAEQRLAARRAARAEAREIRMRELERQQREQEDHADKAYDMYAVKTPGTY